MLARSLPDQLFNPSQLVIAISSLARENLIHLDFCKRMNRSRSVIGKRPGEKSPLPRGCRLQGWRLLQSKAQVISMRALIWVGLNAFVSVRIQGDEHYSPISVEWPKVL